MKLLYEGRKENVFNKYRKKIEKERKLNLKVEETSFYDLLVDENFMRETDYAYLDDLLALYYKTNEFTDYDNIDDIEPNSWNNANNLINYNVGLIQMLMPNLRFFHQNKDRFENRQIRNYHNFSEFMDVTSNLMNTPSKKQEKKSLKSGSVNIYNSDDVSVVKPMTHESSCYYGSGTKWCTSSKTSSTHFDRYSKMGNLYYVFLKRYENNNKYYKVAIQTFFDSPFESSVFWNAEDSTMSKNEEQLFKMVIPQEAMAAIKNDFERTKPNLISKIYEKIQKSPEANSGESSVITKYNTSKGKGEIIMTVSAFDWGMGDDEGEPPIIFGTLRMQIIDSNYKKGKKVLDSVYLMISIYQTTSEYYTTKVSVDMVIDSDLSFKYEKDYFDYWNNEKSTKWDMTSLDLVGRYVRGLQLSVINEYHNAYYGEKTKNLVEYLLDTYNYEYTNFGHGYTLQKGGKLTRRFVEYMKNKGDDEVITKVQALQDLGILEKSKDGKTWFNSAGQPISLKGYYSSFFSAMNASGITKRAPKSGFTKGPKFEKYLKKYDL